jgi:hypothetical protein
MQNIKQYVKPYISLEAKQPFLKGQFNGYCIPLTRSLAGLEMSVSFSMKLEAVTWHTQSPLSYWRLASRTLREQSPWAGLPAHSYLPAYRPTGRPLRSHLQ